MLLSTNDTVENDTVENVNDTVENVYDTVENVDY